MSELNSEIRKKIKEALQKNTASESAASPPEIINQSENEPPVKIIKQRNVTNYFDISTVTTYKIDDIPPYILGSLFAQAEASIATAETLKQIVGRSLGLSPIQSHNWLYFFMGKLTIGALAAMALIKQSKRYDYKIIEQSAIGAKIEFFEDGQSMGFAKFDKTDADRAGLIREYYRFTPNMKIGEKAETIKSTYITHPQNMYVYKAISLGLKWYMPHILGGAQIYEDVYEELRPQAQKLKVAPASKTETYIEEPTETPTVAQDTLQNNTIVYKGNDLFVMEDGSPLGEQI